MKKLLILLEGTLLPTKSQSNKNCAQRFTGNGRFGTPLPYLNLKTASPFHKNTV
jgi:hypothetical protein